MHPQWLEARQSQRSVAVCLCFFGAFHPSSLTGDREKIRVLVDNLISNAIKYSPDGSSLKVKLSLDRAYAYIEVTDAGPGIPEQERERVFEAFYQGKPADHGPALRRHGTWRRLGRPGASAPLQRERPPDRPT